MQGAGASHVVIFAFCDFVWIFVSVFVCMRDEHVIDFGQFISLRVCLEATCGARAVLMSFVCICGA